MQDLLALHSGCTESLRKVELSPTLNVTWFLLAASLLTTFKSQLKRHQLDSARLLQPSKL